MTSRIIPVDPFDYVVFGATGDLAQRKLLPALLERVRDGQIVDGSRILGVAHDIGDTEAWLSSVRESLGRFASDAATDTGAVERFLAMLSTVRVDALSGAGWSALTDALAGRESHVRAFYLAVRPDLFGPICRQLGDRGLVTPLSRVVIEKPIGHDLASAVEVNDAVGAVFDESQIFRIDHYLGKETVQNLMALRFANALYEPLWNHAHIDHVQITVAEQLGVGKRGGYYDKAGALRDMVQNHLLQLLCLVAMEPPDSYEADAVRDEKLKVLRALRPIDNGDVERNTVRGQYRGLSTEVGTVPSYVDEVGVPRSDTETFVALKAEVCNWRWAGVPFYLRTGKRMPERVSEIVIQFRDIQQQLSARAVQQVQFVPDRDRHGDTGGAEGRCDHQRGVQWPGEDVARHDKTEGKIGQNVPHPDQAGVGQLLQQRTGMASQADPEEQGDDAYLCQGGKRVVKGSRHQVRLLVDRADQETQPDVANQRRHAEPLHQALDQRAEDQQGAQGDQQGVIGLHRVSAPCCPVPHRGWRRSAG